MIRVKSKYYHMAEDWMKSYTLIESHIEGLHEELKEIEIESGIGAINYNREKMSQTYKINHQTEDIAIKCIDRKELITKQIELYESKLSRVNRAIDRLQAKEKEILKARYINGKQWYEIAYELSFSEQWCKNIRRSALSNLAVALYGKDAMEDSRFLNVI